MPRSRASEPSRWAREIRDFRRRLLTEALEQAGGNGARAARALGIRRQEFYAYARRLGVPLVTRRYVKAAETGNAEWRELGA